MRSTDSATAVDGAAAPVDSAVGSIVESGAISGVVSEDAVAVGGEDGRADDGATGIGATSERGKSLARKAFARAAVRDRGVRVCAMVALLTVVVAGWFGWSWWSAVHDPVLTAASARDAVLDVGRRDLVRLNTVHYQNPDADLAAWLDLSTGVLHDELSRDRDGKVQGVRAARTSSSAAVRSAAVTRLDVPGGTAELVAVLDVTLTVDGRPPTSSRSRLTAELRHTADGWRIAELTAMAGGTA